MWAMGCILFEMLQVRFPSYAVLEKGVIDPILFRGTECYPLTYSKKKSSGGISDNDQLKVILR
jgi:hypothetical protein